VGPLSSRVRRVETRPKPKGSVDLRSAEVIVSAGRGFKKKEDLDLARALAAAIGGALGASRPLSSDLGWLGEEYHVGLTGIYVRPRLYVAVGISGQLQHVAGIKDSGLIEAINKDKQAPIFQVADYGIVGDLYQVLPALVAALGT
jgi:electron transfer flavoprotein alpha subunit